MESGLVGRERGCVEGKNHSLLGLEGISEISLFGLLILQVRKVRFSDPPMVTQSTSPFPSPLTWCKCSTSLLGLLHSFMWQVILFQDSTQTSHLHNFLCKRRAMKIQLTPMANDQKMIYISSRLCVHIGVCI